MAGNSTLPKLETPQSYEVTIPAPIDTRITQDDNLTASINAQMPVGVRYPGLLFWVNYLYADANDSNSDRQDGAFCYYRPDYLAAEPFESANLILTELSSGGQVTQGISGYRTEIGILSAATGELTVLHNLGTDDIVVSAYFKDVGTSAAEVFQLDWNFDNTNIDLGDESNNTDYNINSKYHAIKINSTVILNFVNIVIIAKNK